MPTVLLSAITALILGVACFVLGSLGLERRLDAFDRAHPAGQAWWLICIPWTPAGTDASAMTVAVGVVLLLSSLTLLVMWGGS